MVFLTLRVQSKKSRDLVGLRGDGFSRFPKSRRVAACVGPQLTCIPFWYAQTKYIVRLFRSTGIFQIAIFICPPTFASVQFYDFISFSPHLLIVLSLLLHREGRKT